MLSAAFYPSGPRRPRRCLGAQAVERIRSVGLRASSSSTSVCGRGSISARARTNPVAQQTPERRNVNPPQEWSAVTCPHVTGDPPTQSPARKERRLHQLSSHTIKDAAPRRRRAVSTSPSPWNAAVGRRDARDRSAFDLPPVCARGSVGVAACRAAASPYMYSACRGPRPAKVSRGGEIPYQSKIGI